MRFLNSQAGKVCTSLGRAEIRYKSRGRLWEREDGISDANVQLSATALSCDLAA